MIKIFGLLIFVYSIVHVLGYFVNQYEYAEVYTLGCVDKSKEPCKVYKGSLRTTFWAKDYVVNNGTKETIISKYDVAAIKYPQEVN